MSPFIKICGLTSLEAAKTVARAGAEMGGFVFFEKSPRHLASLEEARAIAAGLGPGVARVAVTVNARDDELASIIEGLEPDYIQLHGAETIARTAEVKSHFGLPVIKACSISCADDVEAARTYESVTDLLLFDAKPPKEKPARPGGWGEAFDWALVTDSAWRVPWMLAGGLTPENVARAMKLAAPLGLDVSSGVETAPGVKSSELIEEFIAAARGA